MSIRDIIYNIPSSARLLYFSPQIMTWSNTFMPKSLPAAASRFVILMSSMLGSKSPQGWLCIRIIPDAVKYYLSKDLPRVDKAGVEYAL